MVSKKIKNKHQNMTKNKINLSYKNIVYYFIILFLAIGDVFKHLSSRLCSQMTFPLSKKTT